ncbi:MAG: hypothetical protein PWQ44_393 [Methanolobus sp.]|nr:hypothetical protein [Methanolobus sp.]
MKANVNWTLYSSYVIVFGAVFSIFKSIYSLDIDDNLKIVCYLVIAFLLYAIWVEVRIHNLVNSSKK